MPSLPDPLSWDDSVAPECDLTLFFFLVLSGQVEPPGNRHLCSGPILGEEVGGVWGQFSSPSPSPCFLSQAQPQPSGVSHGKCSRPLAALRDIRGCGNQLCQQGASSPRVAEGEHSNEGAVTTPSLFSNRTIFPHY